MHHQIQAKVIADSLAKTTGVRLVTLEIEYPRFILAELNTHRMLSKNSSSSRAIPAKASFDHVLQNTAMPLHWGRNQPGMVAESEVDDATKRGAIGVWQSARDAAVAHARTLSDMGVHKQVFNRLIEPFTTMRTVITGTEWKNFLWLRCHSAAQPEIRALATLIREAMSQSDPMELNYGEWHTPYVERKRSADGTLRYYDNDGVELDVDYAVRLSVASCAQVSYRKLDQSRDKIESIYQRLNLNGWREEPMHASPAEHVAMPMRPPKPTDTEWGVGITHRDRFGDYWSGNLRGWLQYRQMLPGNYLRG